MSDEPREAAPLAGTVDLVAADSISTRDELKGGLPPSGAVQRGLPLFVDLVGILEVGCGFGLGGWLGL